MNQSLGYLKEILAGHIEDSKEGKHIYEKISDGKYVTQEQFVRDLSERESQYLNRILQDAISYSNQEQDEERSRHLNEIYEMLYV